MPIGNGNDFIVCFPSHAKRTISLDILKRKLFIQYSNYCQLKSKTYEWECSCLATMKMVALQSGAPIVWLSEIAPLASTYAMRLITIYM